MKTETELHKGLLEWLGWCNPETYPGTLPPLNANLIRQCHEKMTNEQIEIYDDYLTEAWSLDSSNIKLSEFRYKCDIVIQAAAILKAVGKS